MKEPDSIDSISYDRCQSWLGMYPEYAPKNIEGLDEMRYNSIPSTVQLRKKEGSAFLEKPEVENLMDWKLKHGTYRPKLAQLIAENSIEDIRATTKEAFSQYESDPTNTNKPMSTLTKLRGVGPATASLILSCYDPAGAPFFSDELYRYAHWQDARNGGWDRKISYTVKSYHSLYEKVHAMQQRIKRESGHDISAIGIEKVAYCLGKTAGDDRLRHDGREADEALCPPPRKRRKTQDEK